MLGELFGTFAAPLIFVGLVGLRHSADDLRALAFHPAGAGAEVSAGR